jgi:hypothetical protein
MHIDLLDRGLAGDNLVCSFGGLKVDGTDLRHEKLRNRVRRKPCIGSNIGVSSYSAQKTSR